MKNLSVEMDEITEKIDHLISLLKKKGDQEGFSFEDSKAILCLEILRLELSDLGVIKDVHFGAIGSLIGWSYHYYQIEHNDIFQEFINLDEIREKYNSNPFKADIDTIVGNDLNGWVEYIANSSREFFERKTDVNKEKN